MEIRKIVTIVEETLIEGEKTLAQPVRKAAALAVIKNPFAGRYVEDLSELMDAGEELGGLLGKKAVDALGIDPKEVDSYGKAAIIGENGELEHGAAILHPKMGKPFRAAVYEGKAIIPSAKKRGGMGTAIDVPLHFKNACFVRSHYDAMEVRVPDAPKADEIVVCAVVTDGGRPLPRIGGLKKEEAKCEDGLR